jgi:DNA-binding beta-propeller fold protein YncE
MKLTRNVIVGGILAATLAGLGAARASLPAADDAQTVEAPRFEVDPFWPKPLPNHWIFGQNIGLGIDSRDHVYIVHRADSPNARNELGSDSTGFTAECCAAAPPVVEFDPEGNVVKGWGGKSDQYVWPASNHGLTLDANDNIWIGGNGAGDSHILMFTRDGRYLKTLGIPGMDPPDSNSRERFSRVAKVNFSADGTEAFVADGYRNRRVAVLDAKTGAFKRYWGAYGNRPDDTPTPPYDPDAPLIRQFRTPVHCAVPSRDGLVYVCDRPNDRIQVFRLDGTFVREVRIAPRTRGDGSTWDIAFSTDPEQKYMYLADGKNEKIYVMDRQSLTILTEFGDGGRQPGQFLGVHSIAVDSKGNIYTTETYEGRRLQKFVYKGIGRVPRVQGVPWPGRPTSE